MKPKDSDTFIDIGVSITRLLLIASGQGTAASLIGEGAGLIKNLGRLLGSEGRQAVSAEKIAADVAARLPRENRDISEADWQVAATNVAPLIDRLSEKDRLAAGYNWEALHSTLLDLGGKERRRKLADESAKRAFDWVLDVTCQRIADLFTEKEALASLIEKVNEACAGLQRIERLLNRPGAQETSAVIDDHIEVLRHLVPDTLVDREQELADLEAFVSSSGDAWYAMEADMASGKTAVMASFALNPPDDVHIASFFIRRIGGDGNDRGSFAFVMGAQLAKILGHEYTEPVRDPAQHTEFRQLLCRAAARLSETTPRPLVLLIDGIDEDSYFENPDGADAKSILSLLPRRLPEGVKIITASRPNPRLPEDVLCDADRRIASLKPSPIAEKSINRKDIAEFFKSNVAVDIGAFLAACGGVLTVKDLRRLLTVCGYQRIRTWDVRGHVDRSPGRILTPINVGFGGQEVLAYRLGHDVVTRAVIRELDPDSFGEGDEPEDECWWAPIREKALAPYRAIIRDWVKKCASASGGWGKSTPSYVLSGACFDLMLNDKKDDGSSIQVVLDQGRYNEMRRRSGRKSPVLRMIDRECFKTLGANRGELSENTMTPLLGVAESRKLLVQASTYVPGLLKLYVLYFNIEDALDAIMAVDDPKDRLDALREATETVIESGCGCAFLTLFLDMIKSLVFYRSIRDDVLRLLVDVLVFMGGATSNSKADGKEGVDPEGWLSEVLVSIKMDEILLKLPSSLEDVDGLGGGAHAVAPFLLIAEDVAGRIEDPEKGAGALVEVVGALVRAGQTDRAQRVAEDAVSVAERIENLRERAEALAGVVGALVRAGQTDRAQRVAEDAVSVAERIEDPRERAEALADVAGVFAETNQLDKALEVGERIEVSEERARALADVAGALARTDQVDRSLDLLEQIGEPWECVGTLEDWARAEAMVDVAGALARTGRTVEAFNVIKRIEECEGNMRAVIEGMHMPFEADQTDGTLDATNQVEGPSMRVRALVKVAGELAETDKIKARKTVEDAINAAGQIKKSEERVRIVRALAWVGQTNNAIKLTGQIKESEKRAEALVEVTGALARKGQIDEALDVADRIEYPREHVRALVEVAGALTRVGKVDWAQRVVKDAASVTEQVEYSWERAETLAEMADALIEMGQTDSASLLAKTAARMVGLNDPRILMDVAGVLARVGEVDGALRVAGYAERVAERIGETSLRAEALADVVVTLAKMGQADRALGIAKQIENFEERARALAGVAGALARAGAIDEAREIVTMINEPSSRSRAQSAIIKALVGKGSSNEAVNMLHTAIAEVEGFVRRQDAADYCATLAAACVDAADLVDAESTTHERWLGLARSALARSWLYGAPVWNRFDVLLRVAPDLATRLVEERLLADPEPSPGAESRSGSEPRPSSELSSDPDPEGPGGGTPSSR